MLDGNGHDYNGPDRAQSPCARGPWLLSLFWRRNPLLGHRELLSNELHMQRRRQAPSSDGLSRSRRSRLMSQK